MPLQIQKCLAAHPQVSLDKLQNPPFLAVHFRGARPEYIVAVRDKSAIHRNLAMVCSIDGSIVLGASGQPHFSDMLHDTYMASDWRVCEKADNEELRQYYPKVPKVQHEGVCLTWEDGEAMIYWDGKVFKFVSFQP